MPRLRRSMLFLPGNNARFLARALESEADSIILDLEDAVAPQEKVNARNAVKETLSIIDFNGKERAVRINGLTTQWGHDDLVAVVEGGVDLVVVPKADSDEIIRVADDIITEVEHRSGRPEGSTRIMPLVETALGITNVDRTVFGSPRIDAVAFGSGDYVHSTRGQYTADEWEFLYPRSRVLVGARAAGKMPIGTVFQNVSDMDGLYNAARRERVLGYEGKMIIHPTHISLVHDVFTPSAEEIDYARRVVEAYEESEREGRGATTIDGKLIEHFHADDAHYVLDIARQAGSL